MIDFDIVDKTITYSVYIDGIKHWEFYSEKEAIDFARSKIIIIKK